MPKISVIVPVYNVEKYLSKCLDSVLAQTMDDIEIICINDGSTDDSGKILEQYFRKDNRIKVITQKNKGLSVARNEGLKLAEAEYISFVDSDDFVHPQFLEILYNAVKDNNCDISGCDFFKVYEEKKIPNIKNVKPKVYVPAVDVLLNKKNFIHFNVWNKLYRRDVIKDFSFVEGIYFEDWVFNTCVFTKARSFSWVGSALYGYRISNNSIMRSSYNLKKIRDYVSGIEEVYKFINRNCAENWSRVKQTRIARTVKMMMNSAIRSKDKNIISETKRVLQKLYSQKVIGYSGLSWYNKIKFFLFLH